MVKCKYNLYNYGYCSSNERLINLPQNEDWGYEKASASGHPIKIVTYLYIYKKDMLAIQLHKL